MSAGRRHSDREQCGAHEARITSVENWLVRLDKRINWMLGFALTTAVGSVGTLLVLLFKKLP